MEEEGCMEYMRGLLRDNDLFRAYITVRAGGARRGPGQFKDGVRSGRQPEGGTLPATQLPW